MSISTEKSDITKLYKQNEKFSPDWDLVRQYLPLLKSIVSKMLINFPQGVDREGIYTIGLLGLISASQTYQRSTQAKFGAYASIRIKGALLDELRRMDWLPRTTRIQVRTFKQKVAQREQALGRSLSDEEICNYLHISPKKLSFLKHSSKPYVFIPLDLNYESGNNDGDKMASLEEKIADLTQHTGREVCEKNEVKSLLKTFLLELPKLTQQILALHYSDGLCLSEIAIVFELSESRVCQIHADAITKLRKRILTTLNL